MENTFEKILEPIKELNDLALKNIEEITKIQVNSFQESAKVNVDSLKSAAEIKDFGTLQKYLTDQIEVTQSLSSKAIADAQEIAKLTESYATGVKKIVEKSIPVA